MLVSTTDSICWSRQPHGMGRVRKRLSSSLRAISGNGHCRRNFLDSWDNSFLSATTAALQTHLDLSSQCMATQDFRHATQRESELVANFILRLEHTFHYAYGRYTTTIETRDALFHGQL